MILDRLTVIRFLFDHDILRRTKWRLQQRYSTLEALAASAHPKAAAKGSCGFSTTWWFDWKMALFEADPTLDRALSRDDLMAPLLREFGLLSRAKFKHSHHSRELQLRGSRGKNAGSYGTRHERGTGTLFVGSSGSRLSTRPASRSTWRKRATAPLHIGLTGVVGLYERLGVEFDTKTHHETADIGEMDLFAWSELDANRPSACADKMAHACEYGFGAYYSSPRQYRIARLLLTLHLIARYDEIRHPINEFPGWRTR